MVELAFWEHRPLLVSAHDRGIYGMLFFDVLHSWLLGIVKYWQDIVVKLCTLTRDGFENTLNDRIAGLPVWVTARGTSRRFTRGIGDGSLDGSSRARLLLRMPYGLGDRLEGVHEDVRLNVRACTEILITATLMLFGGRDLEDLDICHSNT